MTGDELDPAAAGGAVLELALDRDPWECQPAETEQECAALAAYLDAGPARRLAELVGTLPYSRAELYALAARRRWRERAVLHDRDHAARAAALRTARAATVAERGLSVAEQLLDRLEAAVPAMRAGDLDAGDAARLAAAAAHLQWAGRGEAGYADLA